MPGLNLRGLRVDQTEALTRKEPIHLVAGTADPVPAVNPYTIPDNGQKFSPGHSAPDPVPSISAEQCDIPTWRGTERVIDPVPARSY